ncbi:hypothetical protein EBU95_17410 [bacterium]|nr:hypothetical protein [bacterium]
MLLDTKVPHNKKRNVGLVYEFIIREVTRATLSNDKAKVNVGKEILKGYFSKNSELLLELKAFKKLQNANFSCKETAIRFMDSVKTETKLNHKKLDVEKTALIHEINKSFNSNGEFFNQFVPDYKSFATIQTVLNSWTNPEYIKENNSFVHTLEDKLLVYLTTPRQLPQSNPEIDLSKNNDKLVVSLMHKKFEEKYGKLLNERQKNILREFILDDKEKLVAHLKEAKEYIVNEIKDKANFKELYEEMNYVAISPEDTQCSFFIGVLDIIRANNGEV